MLTAAFACLALSMTRHQSEVFARPLPLLQGYLLRVAGFLLIAASLLAAIGAFGGGLGIVAWTGHMTVAAGVIFLGLTWRRQRMRKH